MNNHPKKIKVVLVGGGSGGPVAPLLAVATSIRASAPNSRVLFIGTHRGPERQMAENAQLTFSPIIAGKWRRYWSVRNLLTPLQMLIGFVQSISLLRGFRPQVVFGAGSFVQVPVLWAAWVLRVPVMIHQQDIVLSLANTLCAPIARRITVTFPESVQDFPQGLGLYHEKIKSKVFLTGNPCRLQIFAGNKDEAVKAFRLEPNLSTLLVLGGGTGSEAINQLVVDALPQLTLRLQVIHVTGSRQHVISTSRRYHARRFINNIEHAYAAADIVVSRAGLSTITELSNLHKLSIIIPMPDSHQLWNADYLWQRQAAIVADQDELTPERLVKLVSTLLYNPRIQQKLRDGMRGLMPRHAAEKIAEHLLQIVYPTP
jgi:UDP-N-acetylglucosamine--N-acetylmuramyl-(pentapeptide) pyrophosphoryl-undecaprenol N-acetylglucosamine transferase